MFAAFKSIRAPERRDTWAAFFLLFGLLTSHSILETARDALFLSKVPAEQLPWVYIGIAAVSLVITQLQLRLGQNLNRRTALSIWTGAAALVTATFWALLPAMGDAGLFGLYVWSGVLTTLVLVHFWTLLGSIFSIAQAKRLYGVVGTGSVLGAILGSALAGGLSTVVPARHLLLISAVGFFMTAAVPRFMRDVAAKASGDTKEKDGLLESAAHVIRHPYARRVALFVVVSTATLTVADYVFKSVVAQTVPKAELGAFFGATYLGLNLLSLVSQLGLVRFVLRRFNLGVALAILPALLLLGGVAAVVSAGVVTALLIKGPDGALKHSLHRTATELLFVPVSDRSRARVKAFIDVIGQRGGQTVASVIVLAFVAVDLSASVVAIFLVVLAGLWLGGAIDLRRHYVKLVRRGVAGGIETVDFPDLDVASLETLYATLDSSDDEEVVAALAVLDREGRARVVPSLILHHPSDEVVLTALSIISKEGRSSAARTIERLLEHSSPEVRGGAVGALSVLQPNERKLRMLLSVEESPEVRATIMVNLIAMRAIVGSDAKDALNSIIDSGSEQTRVALARGIARRSAAGFDDTLTRLADTRETAVKEAVVEAIGAVKSASLLPVLIRLLGDEPVRAVVRSQLSRFGTEGFEALMDALRDVSTARQVRSEIPRALITFQEERCADLMLAHLPEEPSGFVRYRIIRALETLVTRDPTVVLNPTTLQQALEKNVGRTYRYLERALTLESGGEAISERKTPGHEILRQSLRDKEKNGVERVFRLLSLQHPGEGFAEILHALRSGNEGRHASAVELIENILEPPLRQAVVGLVDDLPDRERMDSAGPFHPRMNLSYEALLDQMLNSSSSAVREMTAFHIGELQLIDFSEHLKALQDRGEAGADVELALQRLQGEDVAVAD